MSNELNLVVTLKEAKKNDVKKIKGLIVQLVAHYIKKKYHDSSHVDQIKWGKEIKNFEKQLVQKTKVLATKHKYEVKINGELYIDILKDVKYIIRQYPKCDKVESKNIKDMIEDIMIPNIKQKGVTLTTEMFILTRLEILNGKCKMSNDFIIDETLAEDEAYIVGLGMRINGGSFVKCLGEAIVKADRNNTLKIKRTFNNYWNEYFKIGKKLYDEENENEKN